jgi:ABC-type dipeptide/oligopeptide/nickel transport system permease subunit
MSILISFLNLLLYIAIIVFIAFVIVWVLTSFLGVSIDANVMKWGRIIVALICAIAVFIWLAGVLGGGTGLPHFFPVH